MKNLRHLRQPIYGSKTVFLPFTLSTYKTFSPSSYKMKGKSYGPNLAPACPQKIKSKRDLKIHSKRLSDNNLFHTFALVKICSSKPPYPLELTPHVFRYDNRPFM